ncbi:winged helix-turn-helix transcriptional regulator [Candidatus Pacearchaeota archaeon]|nr:winged helix-turn-helix transcriptional regulator [Candidatus Pacearchaeota archaeon]
MKQISYENFFANFSNKTRLGILTALMDGPLSVSEIVDKVGGEQSNVSHHLESLRKCSILNVKKEGKKRIYSLNKKTVYPMLELVEKHVGGCGGSCEECGLCSPVGERK